MAKLRINLNLDVTKLDKSRFHQGAKGVYCSLTVFVDTDKADQYGNHDSISQSLTAEERNQQVKLPIVGNAKVFWTNLAQGMQQPQQPQGQQTQGQGSWGQPQQGDW